MKKNTYKKAITFAIMVLGSIFLSGCNMAHYLKGDLSSIDPLTPSSQTNISPSQSIENAFGSAIAVDDLGTMYTLLQDTSGVHAYSKTQAGSWTMMGSMLADSSLDVSNSQILIDSTGTPHIVHTTTAYYDVTTSQQMHRTYFLRWNDSAHQWNSYTGSADDLRLLAYSDITSTHQVVCDFDSTDTLWCFAETYQGNSLYKYDTSSDVWVLELESSSLGIIEQFDVKINIADEIHITLLIDNGNTTGTVQTYKYNGVAWTNMNMPSVHIILADSSYVQMEINQTGYPIVSVQHEQDTEEIVEIFQEVSASNWSSYSVLQQNSHKYGGMLLFDQHVAIVAFDTVLEKIELMATYAGGDHWYTYGSFSVPSGIDISLDRHYDMFDALLIEDDTLAMTFLDGSSASLEMYLLQWPFEIRELDAVANTVIGDFTITVTSPREGTALLQGPCMNFIADRDIAEGITSLNFIRMPVGEYRDCTLQVQDTSQLLSMSIDLTDMVVLASEETTDISLSQSIVADQPIGNISYSTTDWTNELIAVTASCAPSLIPCMQSTTVLNVMENTVGVLVISDTLGNTTHIAYDVDWIDTIAPNIIVSYADNDWTTGPVDVLFTCTDMQSGCEQESYTQSISSNQSGSMTFADQVGNTIDVVYAVSMIDTTPPIGTVSYSDTDPTNTTIIVTVACIDGQSGCLDDSIEREVVENENGTIDIADNVGNITQVAYDVSNIAIAGPTGIVDYADNDWTNGSVIVTVTCQAGDADCVQESYSYTASTNETGVISIADIAGNTTNIAYTVQNIDVDAPFGAISYTPSVWTSAPVNLTVSCVDVLSGCVTPNAVQVTENGAGVIEIIDEAGNTYEVPYEVNWIDITLPSGVVSYSAETWTSGPVDITIECLDNESGCKESAYTLRVNENGSGNISIHDLVGNTIDIAYEVDWIDVASPSGVVRYSTETWTSDAVNITVTCFDSESTCVEAISTLELTENGSGVIEIVDASGNTIDIAYEVDWIDVAAPSGVVSYSNETWTSSDVVVTVACTDGESGCVEATVEVQLTENGSGVVEIEDLVGNTVEIAYEVDWIDKIAPVGVVKYSTIEPTNQAVIATVTCTDLESLCLETSQTQTFTENGSGTIVVSDAAGNSTIVGYAVVNILTDGPTGVVSYSTTDWTNESVLVTATCISEAATCVQDAYTVTIGENSNGTITLTDDIGNTTDLSYQVSTIDKTAPLGTVKYSLSEATNEPVTVMVTCVDGESSCVESIYDIQLTANAAGVIAITDVAGNTTEAAYEIDWIDTVPPVVELIEDLPRYTQETKVEFVVELYESSTVSFYGDCKPFLPNEVLEAGEHTLALIGLEEISYNDCGIAAQDSLSNESEVILLKTLTIDATAPEGEVVYEDQEDGVLVLIICEDEGSGCEESIYEQFVGDGSESLGTITIQDKAGNNRELQYNIQDISLENKAVEDEVLDSTVVEDENVETLPATSPQKDTKPSQINTTPLETSTTPLEPEAEQRKEEKEETIEDSTVEDNIDDEETIENETVETLSATSPQIETTSPPEESKPSISQEITTSIAEKIREFLYDLSDMNIDAPAIYDSRGTVYDMDKSWEDPCLLNCRATEKLYEMTDVSQFLQDIPLQDAYLQFFFPDGVDIAASHATFSVYDADTQAYRLQTRIIGENKDQFFESLPVLESSQVYKVDLFFETTDEDKIKTTYYFSTQSEDILKKIPRSWMYYSQDINPISYEREWSNLTHKIFFPFELEPEWEWESDDSFYLFTEDSLSDLIDGEIMTRDGNISTEQSYLYMDLMEFKTDPESSTYLSRQERRFLGNEYGTFMLTPQMMYGKIDAQTGVLKYNQSHIDLELGKDVMQTRLYVVARYNDPLRIGEKRYMYTKPTLVFKPGDTAGSTRLVLDENQEPYYASWPDGSVDMIDVITAMRRIQQNEPLPITLPALVDDPLHPDL